METAILDVSAGARQERAERLLGFGDAAYLLAVRILGSREGAEDVVQQAYLEALKRLGTGALPEDERAWFLGVVAKAAKMHQRTEARRRRREAAVQQLERVPAEAADPELVGMLRRELEDLEEKYRVAVSLCCEQGLAQREAALVLEMPESTVSKYVNAGLEALRKSLARRGYTAAAPAVIGGLKLTGEAAPASLVSALQSLAAGGALPGAAAAAAQAAGLAAGWKLAAAASCAVILAGGAVLGSRLLGPGTPTPPALPAAATAVSETPPPGALGGTLLDADSSWRCHAVWKNEMMRTKAGALEPLPLIRNQMAAVATPPPPADWAGPDFDDSAWPRFCGGIPSGSRHLALLCLRGKFLVLDNAAAPELTLSMDYRGGVVVHLNGKELTRAHLPAGKIEPDTFAEDYPEEAYVDPDGKLLRKGFGDPEKYKDRFAMRRRSLKDFKIPAALLRKGVNVLAVEIHRAPTAEVQVKGKSRSDSSFGANFSQWTMLGVEELKLSAPPGAPVASASWRPKGLAVWSFSPVQKLHVNDAPDPCEAGAPAPVRIAGCRNGAFAGVAVVSSAAPIQGLKVQPGELKQDGGPGRIAPERIQVRFAVADEKAYKRPDAFDALEDAPPETVQPGRDLLAVQPIWITVRVPADAPAGDYAGSLAVQANAAGAVQVPVSLRVAGWTLPAPRDYASHIGLTHSPESVSMHYKVPLWSDEHFRLMDREFALMAEAGCGDIFIPVIAKTATGNEHGMVRFIKQPGGGYKCDYSLAEKYLDAAVKRLGKPPVVCIYLWHCQGGSWMNWGSRNFEQAKGAPITILDPETGQLSEGEAPKWGSPESQKFWKPVVDGLREILAKRDLAGSMMVGTAFDQRPPKETHEDLKAIAPDLPWVIVSHNPPTDVLGGQPIGYGAYVHCTNSMADPAAKRRYGWQTGNLFCAFPRYGAGGIGALRGGEMGIYRWCLEGLFVSGHRGIGWVGADFWEVPGGHKEDGVYCRYEPIKGDGSLFSIRLKDSNTAVLAAGRAGPVATIRFELLREGAQETDARVFLEKILTDKDRRAKLGEELAGRVQRLLDERARRMILMLAGDRVWNGFPSNWDLFQASGWQDLSAELYAAASEAAAKLGGK